jgi:hypothetical protein
MFSKAQLKARADHMQRICDMVPHMELFRADVQTGVLAKQLVTVTMMELFRHEFPETKWMNGGLINHSTSVDEGASEFAYLESIGGGEAQIVAPNATDLPVVDVEGRNNLRNIHTVAEAITYSTQDLRAARLNGVFDIATEKAANAREAMDRGLERLIRVGSPRHGLSGVVNHPGILVQIAGTGGWQTATAAQIVADFTIAAKTPMDQSDAVEVPNTALFDVASWTRISTLQNSVASDITVLQFLQRAFPNITRWDWEPGLSTADAAGTGPAVLVYDNNARKQKAVFPMMMQALPPERKGLSFEIAFESRFGGVIMPRPRAMLRLDGV